MSYKTDFNNDTGWAAADCSRKLNTSSGEKFVRFLHSREVTTVVRYYASSRRAKTLSDNEALFLSEEGFNILPVYQDNNRTVADFGKASGRKSATNALEFANYIGQPTGSTILFAVDADFLVPNIKEHIIPYFEAVNKEVDGEFRIGAYGSGAVLKHLMSNGLIEVPWLSMSRGFTGTKKFFYSEKWAMRQVPPEQRHTASGTGYDKNVLRWTPKQLGAFNVGVDEVDRRASLIGVDAILGGGYAPVEDLAEQSLTFRGSVEPEAAAVLRMGLVDFSQSVLSPEAVLTRPGEGPNFEVIPVGRGKSATSKAGPSLTGKQRRICEQVINVFETGSVRGEYDAISIYADGPGDVRQITYGRSQTTEYGNLPELIQMYAGAAGMFAAELKPYLGKIGKTPLVDDARFKRLLRQAGKKDPVMRATQDRFFDKRYFKPALKWAGTNGFTSALSVLVIYDSFIHSGSIRRQLRRRFSERPPASGGNEREWIRQYVRVRHQWLSNHRRPAVRASNYRTRDLAREIGRDNWELASVPIMANGTSVRGEKIDRATSRAVMESLQASDASASIDARSVLADARFLATEGAAASGSDETILKELAEEHDLVMPVERLISLRNERYEASRPRYWGVVNFDLHSSKPRLFVFDVVEEAVVTYLCSHGIGSEGPTDDGMADEFSNMPGTGASSLGIYRCAETYISNRNGYSLRLDGLEDSNSNARSRYIVMHGADYVSRAFVRNTGRAGRSEGCPAVDHKYARKVIDQLKLGSLLNHWKTP